MTEDATLADFLEDDGAPDEGEDGAADEGDAKRGSEDDDVEHGSEDATGPPVDDGGPAATDPEVEPATPTAAWGTYVCRDCGSSARRVWRDGDGYVCSACKSW